MVKSAVVVAGQRTARFACEALERLDLSILHLSRENVKAVVISGRNKRNSLTVGRPAWLRVHSTTLSDLARCARDEVQQMEFDRVLLIGGVNNPAAVRRTIGLIIVSGASSQLLGYA